MTISQGLGDERKTWTNPLIIRPESFQASIRDLTLEGKGSRPQ
jgi:hypothetical protein